MEQRKYMPPTIIRYGDIMKLTEAGKPYGTFDASYGQGQPIPSGGAGNNSTP